MMVLIGLSMAIFAFMAGVCIGASAVEDVRGEPRLPGGWWVLPGAIMGGLLTAAAIVLVL